MDADDVLAFLFGEEARDIMAPAASWTGETNELLGLPVPLAISLLLFVAGVVMVLSAEGLRVLVTRRERRREARLLRTHEAERESESAATDELEVVADPGAVELGARVRELKNRPRVPVVEPAGWNPTREIRVVKKDEKDNSVSGVPLVRRTDTQIISLQAIRDLADEVDSVRKVSDVERPPVPGVTPTNEAPRVDVVGGKRVSGSTASGKGRHRAPKKAWAIDNRSKKTGGSKK